MYISVREMVTFFGKTFMKRTEPGKRQTILHEGYNCHVYLKKNGLGAIVVADLEYPARVAFALMTKLLDRYDKENRETWKKASSPVDWAPLNTALIEYQDPSKADKIASIQRELDETTSVLVGRLFYYLNINIFKNEYL